MLYESYFMYYEDVDFCVRARRAGYPLYSVKIPGIMHEEKGWKNNNNQEYYLARNHLLFVERLAPMWLKTHEILRLPKTYYEHMSKKEYGAAAGVRDYLLRRFGKRKESL